MCDEVMVGGMGDPVTVLSAPGPVVDDVAESVAAPTHPTLCLWAGRPSDFRFDRCQCGGPVVRSIWDLAEQAPQRQGIYPGTYLTLSYSAAKEWVDLALTDGVPHKLARAMNRAPALRAMVLLAMAWAWQAQGRQVHLVDPGGGLSLLVTVLADNDLDPLRTRSNPQILLQSGFVSTPARVQQQAHTQWVTAAPALNEVVVDTNHLPEVLAVCVGQRRVLGTHPHPVPVVPTVSLLELAKHTIWPPPFMINEHGRWVAFQGAERLVPTQRQKWSNAVRHFVALSLRGHTRVEELQDHPLFRMQLPQHSSFPGTADFLTAASCCMPSPNAHVRLWTSDAGLKDFAKACGIHRV